MRRYSWNADRFKGNGQWQDRNYEPTAGNIIFFDWDSDGIIDHVGIVGFGVLEYNSGKFTVVDYGAITTSSDMDFNRRLKVIYDDMTEIITTYKPDEMGIEKLFFNTNEKTAIDVAQARGVTLLPAIIRNIPIYEYTPLQVKCSIVGYGRAEKKQVQEMTKTMLHLKSIPKPDDTADAVAIAITHGLSVNTRRVMKNFEEK